MKNKKTDCVTGKKPNQTHILQLNQFNINACAVRKVYIAIN